MKSIKIIDPKPEFEFRQKRVAAYARVSVETELANHSLASQIEHYSNFIKQRSDWVFAGVYADEGLSGTKSNRPGFQRLLQDCNEGKIDQVIVKSLSRFARNTVDLLETVRHLKSLEINIFFEKENINTISAQGELLLTLLASFAQEEARSTSENNRWTVQKRFEQGKVNSFFLYGYKWNGESFDIVPEQAKIVKEIYESYLNGMSPDQITNALKARNIPSTRGKDFTYTLVWAILRLEKYTGNSLLNKVYCEDFLSKKYVKNRGEKIMYFAEGTHPQIISQETFDAVQAEIQRRQELGYLANQSLHFSCFTGKVFCAECGHTFRRRMSGMKHRINRQYIWKCGNKIKNTSSACKSQNINERNLYSLTSEILKMEQFTKEDFDKAISKIEVSFPNTLTFYMKDNTTISKRWKCTSQNTHYKELYNGKNSNCNTANTDSVFI